MKHALHNDSPCSARAGGRAVFFTGLAEAALVAALVATPLVFNLSSKHLFEIHKMGVFKALAFVAAPALLLGRTRTPGEPQAAFRDTVFFPVLVYALALALSTALSLSPLLSLFGEVYRQNGFVTETAALLTLVAAAVLGRSADRAERLVTAVIVASVPVALYALLQRMGADPVPWMTDVRERAIGSLGNAVFLGAFLVMAFFPALARALSRMSQGRPGSALAHFAAAALQAAAVWFSQSRGPLLALMAGLAGFAVILFRARREVFGKEQNPGVSGRLFSRTQGEEFRKLPGRSKLGGVLPTVVFLAVLAALFVVFQSPQPGPGVKDPSSDVGLSLERQGSIKKRILMWQGYISVLLDGGPVLRITQTDPPGAAPDSLHAARLLIGHGPETMGGVFRQRYPQELLETLSPTETADRAHNDFLHRLLTTGLLGLGAFLWVVLAALGRGFAALGYAMDAPGKKRLLCCSLGGMTAGAFGAGFPGLEFTGAGAQAGFVAGVLVFALAGRRRPGEDTKGGVAGFLMTAGLLAAALSHVAETTVSFPFSATLLVFSVFLGLSASAGARAENAEDIQGDAGERGRTAAVFGGALAGLAVAVLFFSVLGGTFPAVRALPASGGGRLVLAYPDAWPHALTVFASAPRPPRATALANTCFYLALALPSFLLMLVLAAPKQAGTAREMLKNAARGALPALFPLSAALLVLFALGKALSGLPAPLSQTELAGVAQGVLDQTRLQTVRVYALFMLLALFCLASAFYGTRRKGFPRALLRPGTLYSALALTVLAALFTTFFGLGPMLADMYAMTGEHWNKGAAAPFMGTGSKTPRLSLTTATAINSEALRRAPLVQGFAGFLASSATLLAEKAPREGKTDGNGPFSARGGRAAREVAALSSAGCLDLARKALLNARRVDPVDPLNARNLARLFRKERELAKEPDDKPALAARALSWYGLARDMMPENAYLENETAALILSEKSNPGAAVEILLRSLVLDPDRPETWRYYANARMEMVRKDCPELMALAAGGSAEQTRVTRDCMEAAARLVPVFEKVLALTPEKTDDIIRLAGACLVAGVYDKALGHIEAGLAKSHRNPALSGQLFIYFKQTGDTQGVEAMFQRLYSRHPSSPALLLTHGQFSRETGDAARAKALSIRAAGLGRMNPAILADAARMLAGAGDWKNALRFIQDSLKIRPDARDNWVFAAQLHDMTGNPMEAAKALEEAALRTREKHALAALYISMAHMYNKAGQNGLAAEAGARAAMFQGR
jgi:predicted Zn-dependent protease/O-antigen ligase